MRRLVLDSSAAKLVDSPQYNSSSLLDFFKAHTRALAEYGYINPPRGMGHDAITGAMMTSWWHPPIDHIKRAYELSRRAYQDQQIDFYIAIASLPKHQDSYSVRFTRGISGDDTFNKEFMSMQREVATAMQMAFEQYSVRLFKARTAARIADTPVDPRDLRRFRGKEMQDYWGGLRTLLYQKPLQINVFCDPSGGGVKSDCVIVSMIGRHINYPEMSRQVQQPGRRTYGFAMVAMSYMVPLECCVRRILS